MVVLLIAYEEPGRKPLSVCSVDNAHLIRQAALLALEEAEEEVAVAALENPTTAKLRSADAQRLRTTLQTLIPGLETTRAM